MPLTIPTLAEVRRLNRDNIVAHLPGADAAVPNAALRVLSDADAGLAYLNFLYLEGLAAEFLPDQAYGAFLDRWADIYGVPREAATFAVGTAAFTGAAGTALPAGTPLAAGGLAFATTAAVVLGAAPTPAPIRALAAGAAGVAVGAALSITVAVAGADAGAKLTALTDGVDAEGDGSLRERVLARIRQPPQGGAAHDYVAWARAVPGVTRAWCSPHEMGPGSVAVRFMMDVVRADNLGLPTPADVAAVRAYIDERRPVTVQDCHVGAPVFEPIDYRVRDLVGDGGAQALRNASAARVRAMLLERARPAHAVAGRARPAQTIYAAWVSDAISETPGVAHFALDMADHVMPYPAALAVLGRPRYA